MSKNILITAFHGTSSELLIKDIDSCKTLVLPNDKIRDSENLIQKITKEGFKIVVSFGQKPSIKNKVHIETTARHGEICIGTVMDCEKLKSLFVQNGIEAKISNNAGTSFCNSLYFNGLNFIKMNDLNIKMIFIHIPFTKNITNIGLFCKAVLDTILSEYDD